ncbi:MAG: 5'/3'-nucleotidase SurE [Bacteroidales bacterium]
MTKPTILITNDDGIAAPGLRTLIAIMRRIGNVIVVAPDKPQSGMAHAITITTPLRVSNIVKEVGYEEYSTNGTPVDCVKLGQKVILRRNPDLLVSGINHGSNSSINIIYSGTMAAVLEGAMEDIPSIGFSMSDYSHNADFSQCGPYITKLAENVLEKGLPQGTCLNVNIPAPNGKPISGIKVVRQAKAFWDEDFEERKDPHHRDYYWLRGIFVNRDEGIDTDEWALANNFVSVVPVKIDLTAYDSIPIIKAWNLE